jgi:hypothetical protein
MPSVPYGRAGRWIGLALLINYLIAVLAKLAADKGPELFWMSHVGLLMAALGLIARRRWLVGAALTGVAVIHLMWITDAAVGLTTGSFPLRMADYLPKGDLKMWLGTAHHFYLVPLLAVLIIRDGHFPWRSLPVASLIFFVLTLISRYALSEQDNVNCAYLIRSGPSLGLITRLNGLKDLPYLLALNAGVTLLLFFPIALALRGATSLRQKSPATPVAGSAA